MRYLILSILLSLTACGSLQKFNYPVFLFGPDAIYRKLNDGTEEYIPFTSPELEHFLAVDSRDLAQ